MQGIDNTRAGGALSSLSDVNISSPVVGDLLIYNGSEWINDDFAEGHTILNESGTAVTARDNLQFTDGLKVTDDSANNKTKVGINTTFTEAETRTNINSGDTFSTILGKIKKWFSDLPSMFVRKSGDTVNGTLAIQSLNDIAFLIDRSHSATVSQYVTAMLGNNKPDGTAGSTYGYAVLYGKGAYGTWLSAQNSTANRDISFPDASGTVALTNDLNTKYLSVFSGRSGANLMPWTADSDMQIDLTPTCDRISADLNDAPIRNRAIFEEYNENSSNLPKASWHYVLTIQGDDTNYAGQLAIGMLESQVYSRRKSGGSWYSWKPMIPKLSGITKQISISALAAGGEAFDQDYSWSDSTYTILGIAGYQLEGNNYTRCCFNRMSFRNGASKHIFYSIRNTSTTDATGALTLTVQLLVMM